MWARATWAQPRFALTATTGITRMLARLTATGLLTISRTACLSVLARGSMASMGAVSMAVVTMDAVTTGTADADSMGGVVGMTADAISAAAGSLTAVDSEEAREAASVATVVSEGATVAADSLAAAQVAGSMAGAASMAVAVLAVEVPMAVDHTGADTGNF